ncbi:polysaccharide deacetylase family protein [Brevibacillus fulvus]|uniref:Biofilm PGA synthesis lipoprotein PgaB n=1 Tax=Brevibacillus fulvus TaxID=1125967 RepID=A0A938Y3Y5_9BACL|nr:polysaccharide deacetylase family protein [Brevibacillus fulvus]MBM7591516.1 biofilm PGA synthesis lipoprotein PgaB [Brevibacillus fulvus]
MNKRILFLFTFLVTLALVIAGGVGIATKSEKNAAELQHFAQENTSKEQTQQGKREDTVQPTAAAEPQSAKPVAKQTWYENQVVVLMYHHVTDQSDQPYVITPEGFAAHMQFLKENDLHPISLTQFVQFVQTGVSPVDNAVLITFDDGYESYYTEAFPILKQYQFPSVNFLITGRLKDSSERKRPNVTPPLTYQEIQEMRASGLAEFGSHTYSLHGQEAKNEWGELGPETAPVYLEDLGRLEDTQEYRDRLYVDFLMSRIGLGDLLGERIQTISLPFGFTNEVVIETAKQAGYEYVFNSHPAVVKPGVDPFSIPRFDVGLREIDAGKLRELFAKARDSLREGDHGRGT